MEIEAKPDQWTPIDAERLATFLNTETGKRLLPCLADKAPLLLPSGDVNAILIRSGEVRGQQDCLNNILHLAHGDFSSKPVAVVESYPNLEDDKKWNDGQQLTPIPPADKTAQE